MTAPAAAASAVMDPCAGEQPGTALAVLLVGEASANLADFRPVVLTLASLGVLTALLGLRVPQQEKAT